jgi:hypothetical protein
MRDQRWRKEMLADDTAREATCDEFKILVTAARRLRKGWTSFYKKHSRGCYRKILETCPSRGFVPI